MIAPVELYANTTTSPDRGRYGIREAIERLKGEISIEDYLRTHGVEVRRNRARCIVHGGDNATSFSIDPERQLWHCFSCGEGGDLINLCEAVERHADTWTAVISLAMQFDVLVPEKSNRWRAWQDEKGRRRAELTTIRTRLYQRRLLRFFREDLEGISDPDERREETRRVYADLWYLARLCAERRAN